jgi:hypothetical protein
MLEILVAMITKMVVSGQYFGGSILSEHTGMKRGGRKGLPINPLNGKRVTTRYSFSNKEVTFASQHKDRKVGPLWPSKEHPDGCGKHIAPFLVQHIVTGQQYLMLDRTFMNIKRCETLISDEDGSNVHDATDEELAIIERYSDKGDGNCWPVKLQNVVSLKVGGERWENSAIG